jgi:hypothetical protein
MIFDWSPKTGNRSFLGKLASRFLARWFTLAGLFLFPLSIGFVCHFLSLPKLPFSMEPELFIPSERAAMFFPDFPRAFSDEVFVGLCQCTGLLFEFLGKCRDALHRFSVAEPPRQVAVSMS